MSRVPVLVVDDDEMSRSLLETALAGAGYDVTVVDGGAVAISMLETHRYEAILLDMLMPLVDGFQVIQFLVRNDPRLLERVIVVSALGDKFLANFDPTLVHAFHQKPIDRRRLLATVAECVDLHRDRPAGTEP